MSNGELPGEHQHIQQIVEENNRLLKELQAQVTRVQRYIQWSQIWGLFRFCIILAPIIIGLIYLKPYVQKTFSIYQDLFNVTDTFSNASPSSGDLLDQFKP